MGCGKSSWEEESRGGRVGGHAEGGAVKQEMALEGFRVFEERVSIRQVPATVSSKMRVEKTYDLG